MDLHITTHTGAYAYLYIYIHTEIYFALQKTVTEYPMTGKDSK